MSLNARRYSKAKANGNHVVFTGDQVFLAPYKMSGLLRSDDFAFLRIAGQGVVCSGVSINFQVPAGDRAFRANIALVTSDDQVLSFTQINFSGIQLGGNYDFVPQVQMPSGSLWKARVTITDGDSDYYPQDLNLTYQLRFANGPTRSNLWATTPTPDGIGFYTVDGTFVVQ